MKQGIPDEAEVIFEVELDERLTSILSVKLAELYDCLVKGVEKPVVD
jgi:hypothetical protein